jgi:hypothetical protein
MRLLAPLPAKSLSPRRKSLHFFKEVVAICPASL